MSDEYTENGFDLSNTSLSDLFGQEEDFDILEDGWEEYKEGLDDVEED